MGIGLDRLHLPSSPKVGHPMKSKLEGLIAYLADRGGEDAERIRNELGDPTSEASQLLAATRELSQDAFAEQVLQWLGLPGKPMVKEASLRAPGAQAGMLVLPGPAIPRQKPWPPAIHATVRILPWLLSVTGCIVSILLWLDCRKHRHELETALQVAVARQSEERGPRIEDGGSKQADEPHQLRPLAGQSQRQMDSGPIPKLPSARGEPEQKTDNTKTPITETKEEIGTPAPSPAKANAEQENIKKRALLQKTPVGTPDTGDKGVVIFPPGPSVPSRAQVPDSREPVAESKKPEQVAVPKIQGLSYAEAKKRVEAAGLVLKTVRNSETGLVKSQTPAAGSLAKQGEVVLATLTPDVPLAAVQVPNVCGMTGAKNVELLLTQAGLTFAAYRVVNGKRILIAPQAYNQLEKYKVVKQHPLQGASVPSRTCIECTFEAP
jgi:hypothetical protein